jgi:uncharacterized membrane protein
MSDSASHPLPLTGTAGERVRLAVRERGYAVAVWVGSAAWALAVFAIARDRYLDFRYARYDLGNMVQAVWSTAHGRPLESTDAAGEQVVRLGGHVDPILAALAPLWVVFPSPLTLAAVQVAAVALGAVPVFWLGRRHLESEGMAALLALAYLAYPWIAWSAVDTFHPVTLAIPLFLFCIWFLEDDRLVPFALCAVPAALTGELMGATIAALGIWYALARGRRLAGAAIALGGAAWTWFALAVIVPAFAKGGESIFYGAYERVGGTPWGLLRTTVTDPGAIVAEATGSHDLLYVALLGAPLCGLFLLAPGLAAVALPALAANVLAAREHTTDPHVHYISAIVPFLFAATAVGLARLSPSGRSRAIGVVATVCLAATVAVGPWPGSLLGASDWDGRGTIDTSPKHVHALESAIALVPSDAAVSATNRLGSHLSARRRIFSAPFVGSADWVVLDMSDPWTPDRFGGSSDPEDLLGLRQRLEASRSWKSVYDVDGIVVFERETR